MLPKPSDDKSAMLRQKLFNRLVHLHRSITELQQEKGLYDLYIGFPFLVGIPAGSETVIQAPIFLIPVVLEKVTPKKGSSSWAVTSSKDTPVCFNKTLFYALAKLCSLTVNSNLFEEEIPDELYGATSFIEWTHQLLNEYGIHVAIAPDARDRVFDPVQEFSIKELPTTFQPGKLEVCQHAVLGHFPQSNSSIQKDYDKFLESDQTELDSITCFLSGANELLVSDAEGSGGNNFQNANLPDQSTLNQISDRTIDDRQEANNFFLLPSDSSQDRILLDLVQPQTTGMVIWGPPGTGKSQTIVNIIGDCLARNKTVLLVSQKRAALDVVYDRLGLKNLSDLVGLVHDSKTDRKPLYSKIIGQTSRDTSPDGRAISVPFDPSSELDRIAQTLRDIFKAYNDDSNGLKLGEMYRQLGGDRESAISLDSYWKTKRFSNLNDICARLRSVQHFVKVHTPSKLFKGRRSFSQIDHAQFVRCVDYLEQLITDPDIVEAKTILSLSQRSGEKPAKGTDRVIEYFDALRVLSENRGVPRSLKWSVIKARLTAIKHLRHAKRAIRNYIHEVQGAINLLLTTESSVALIAEITKGNLDTARLAEFTAILRDKFYELKSYDLAVEQLSPEARLVVSQIESLAEAGKVSREADWGRILERSALSLWVMELEKRHSVIALVRGGQIEALRQRYSDLLKQKVEYCVHQLKEKTKTALSTPQGKTFSREINGDASRTRKAFSIRKLNEKFLDRPLYQALLPVWLVSPESVSDVFPLKKGLFDVVIFDEASQCSVEHGLPAIFRGKQVIIAGDEKQLPPNRLFESLVGDDDLENDEEAHATEEPSLLTLAKKTLLYKSYMLEWHYRSRHPELVTYSNETFYNGRMKIAPNVIPFRKGNPPAIAWHTVTGYWEDRTNRQEAEKVIELVRQYLSEDKQPTVGVITFNISQKELILDMLEELQNADPELAELLDKDKQRPIDSRLFIKNIENVQGDERENIIFSVAYAPSVPNGRVNQLFGTLNSKGGENRLNVAITRAIKRIDVVASIDPQKDLDVSMSANAGPKILKNYLCFAKAVASEDMDRVATILNEINPNLNLRSEANANVVESPFENEVMLELQRLGLDVHTQVGQSGFRIDMAVVHPKDSSRYLLGIECDGAMFHSGISVRERDVFRQRFLEDRGWKIHRVWSSNWWDNKHKEVTKIRALIETLCSK